MEDAAMPKYVQMWLPGFEPPTEQPDLPGLDPNEGIEPSVGDVEGGAR